MENFNTKQVGNLTELQCATKLYELGCRISIPFGNSEKYDLIADINNKLYRIQCKHANPHYNENGEVSHISFKCTWQSHNTQGWTRTQYKEDEVEFFATFYNDNCYLIPVAECSNEKNLRILPTKNNQTKGISFLKDFLAQEVIKKL